MTPPGSLYAVMIIFGLLFNRHLSNLITSVCGFLRMTPLNVPLTTGISSFLPPGVHAIRNKEGVHGAISFFFRNPQASQLLPDELIDKYQSVADALRRRMRISLMKEHSSAIFHIGQVVIHKSSGCRCVVIGAYLLSDLVKKSACLHHFRLLRPGFSRTLSITSVLFF